MSIFRTHVLVPVDEGTVQAGVFEVKRELENCIKARGLEKEVKVLETGTIGLVGKGVSLVVFPENVCYFNLGVHDVATLVDEHIIKGRVVNRFDHARSPKGGEKVVIPEQKLGLVRPQKRIILDRGYKADPENIDEIIALGGYKALERVVSEQISPEGLISEIKRSGLRGRGGAGFPTGLKWEFTRNAPGEEKYLICNADEGEPGTFKDRLILEGDPHKLIEAMVITGYAIGAKKGYIYIRGEYELSIQRTQKAIDQARAYNLLGKNILESGIDFDLEIRQGAGAYVCGEETSLIESLEGKRGNPRIKPPYPGTKGLWQKPTVVNNVETLANVPGIIEKGAEWFRSFGTEKCPGTKVFTILGNIEYPGLIEVEMGTSLREIIFSYGGGIKGGKKFKAALLGGAAGVFLPEDLLDVAMDFESLKENKAVLGSGAILVMDEDASIVDMLFSILKFFAHESCGQCVPCRVGTTQLLDLIYKIRDGRGEEKDISDMMALSTLLVQTSLCPLGQSLLMPVASAINHFREEFKLTEQRS
jgi:NADH:ubiquinone oxidoreductase subunit F (NADH-binding)/(2Fe-2S) ferredoxin